MPHNADQYPFRVTEQVRHVMSVMLNDPEYTWTNSELSDETGIPMSTVPTILAKLRGPGWLIQTNPTRGRAFYYRLSPAGVQGASRILREDLGEHARDRPVMTFAQLAEQEGPEFAERVRAKLAEQDTTQS